MSLKSKFAASGLAHMLARHTPLMDGVAKKLVPATTAEQAVEVTKKLNKMGYHVCLHHLGRPSKDVADIQRNVAQLLEAIEMLDDERMEVCLSLIPSELGYLHSAKSGETHCREIGQKFSHRVSVRDVEERQGYGDGLAVGERNMLLLHASERVAMQKMLALWHGMDRAGVSAGLTLPSALMRSEDDAKELISDSGIVRLSLLPPHVVDARSFMDEDLVVENYLKLAALLLSDDALLQQVFPVFALEDAELAQRVCAMVARENWSRDAFEFEIPYGVNNALKKKLHQEGYRVRILVPFGKDWWPYYQRRTQA